MSEKYPVHHEQNEHLTNHEAHSEELRKKHEQLVENESTKNTAEQLEYARNKVEQHALQPAELTPAEKHESQNHHPVIVHKELKDMAFSRSMTRVRKHLSVPSKVFSKVIHTPIIDTTSEFVGKTVARPSSMLAGAFLAFIGTSALLWATRYYGYEYNYLAVILLFVVGGILGVASEGLWRVLRKKQ